MNYKPLFILASFAATFAYGQTNGYATNQILVKYKSGSVSTMSKLAIGGTTVGTLKEINVEKIRISGVSASQAINIIKADPNVVYAELDPKRYLDLVPNDPRLSEQYGIDQVKAKQAWDLTTNNGNTIVCVIDTGIRKTHEELVGRIATGCYDWSDNDSDVTDDTGSGHGTHCSGIAAAGTNNGKGIASVAYNAKLLHMKIFPNSFASTSASAMIDAANKGARVISMSYGSSAASQTEQDAVNYAWNKGVILFAAAGNNGDTVKHYPAALNNVIAVAATNNLDQRASFSTYGDWVHIAAPGENILSSFFDGDSSYVYESGTSMACPFAASVAGLMIGRNPSITNAQVRDIIFTTCDNVGTFIQKGRINAFKAVKQVVQPVPFVSTPVALQVGVVGGVSEGTQVGSYGSPALAAPTVKSADGISYQIASVPVAKLGTAATADVYVQMAPATADVLSANLTITGRSVSNSSCLIFLFNFTTGAWDQFGSMSMSTSNKTNTFSIPLTSLSKYLNGSNMFRIMARNLLPLRSGSTSSYTFTIDQLNVVGTNKSST